MKYNKNIFTIYNERIVNKYAIGVFVFLISFLILTKTSFGQHIPDYVINKYNLKSTSTFFDIQKAMNEYWASLNVKFGFVTKNGVETKVPGWKIYKRWEYYWEQRVNQNTGEFPNTSSDIEFDKYKNNPNNSKDENDYSESWVNLGTNTSGGGYAGLGRINCVAFHPTDVNTFWVGSPSGGIWKTTNGGTNWTILNNNQSVLGVSVIVIPSDYTTSNTIYIATGDRDGGSMWSLSGGQIADNASIGVLKSTDGGTTWNPTGLTYTASQKKIVYSLVIHPTNNSILFAATSDGLYKSTNGGTTWTSKEVNIWNSIQFKPGDPTIMYATNLINYGSTYMVRSTNSGESWSFFAVTSTGIRGEIAVSPNDPAVVYLLAANNVGNVDGVYKSTNSGVNFTKVNNNSATQPGMLGYYTDGRTQATGQGSYDWCIAASPTDANTVFIGGITTWKSTDGGVNWAAINNWTSGFPYNTGVAVVHADKHALAYQNNTTLFEGNDGGIYKTTNGGTNWIDLTNGLVISQIYRIGVSQTSSTTVMTGLQDNGSKLYNSGSWSDVTGGDGMECIVDYTTTQYMYSTYVTGTIYRSLDGGVSFPVTISANIPGGQPTGAWVTPYIIDPNNSSTLYAGFNQVWKTTNRGNNWSSASQVLSSSIKLRSLAIAPSNSNVLYTADQTNMWKTTDGGATNWSTVTLPTTTNNVTYITVKNTDPNTLWITYGGYTDGSKVYESTNGGTSWTNISAGLPNLPTMCIVYNKHATDREVLFAGMDVGVYVKDGANNWASFSTGLPNVVVSELEIYYGGSPDKLRAGTFGRGLWETNIESALPVELSSFTSTVNKNTVQLSWTTSNEINNKGFDIERKSDVNSVWQKSGYIEGKGNSNQSNDYSFSDTKLTTGKYQYRLKQIDFNGNIKYHKLSEEVTIGLPDNFSLSQNYPNPFNPKTKIDYEIPIRGKVVIMIYNQLGQEMLNLINETKDAGYYTAEFDGSNLASGIYFYRISLTGERKSYSKMLKMALIK